MGGTFMFEPVTSEMKLSSIITLSPSFATAVNILHDLANDRKVSAYIPTNTSTRIIVDIARSLHPASENRVCLITGSYGTGKSHLGLFLSRYFLETDIDSPSSPLFPVLEKIRGRSAEQYETIVAMRKRLGKFLLVMLWGGQETINRALLKGLHEALRKAKLEDILPDTAYQEAVNRIEEWRKDLPDIYARFESHVLKKAPSLSAFIQQLNNFEESLYRDPTR